MQISVIFVIIHSLEDFYTILLSVLYNNFERMVLSNMNKLSIRNKLILIFIIIFTIPIIISQLIFREYATRFSKESIEILNINNMKYIGASTDQFFGTIYNFSFYINMEKNITAYFSSSPNSPDIRQKQSAAQDVLSLLPFSNKYIKSVAVFGNNGQYVGSGNTQLTFSEQEKAKAKVYQGYYFWSVTPKADGSNEVDFCRLLRQPQNLSNEIGYLKIRLNMEDLDSLLSNSAHDGYSYFLVNENDELIYHFGDFDDEAILQYIKTNKLVDQENKTIFLDKWNCYVTPNKLTSIPWHIYSINKNIYTSSILETMQKVILIFTVLCFVFCFVLALIFTNVIVSPLKKLGHLMEHIENEDYTVRFRPNGNDEIAILATQFDQMTEKLHTLYNEVYLNNLKLKESQLSALQSQINPHFLYNTLDTIYWMSQFHHTEDVSQMVSALSRLFRLSLSGDKNDMVPLESELEHVRCYMYIQQIRYQDHLSYTIDTQVDTKHLSALKLILQPIVENAILHGIDKRGCGNVKINIFEQDDNLVYEVIDDAGTADVEKISKLLNSPVQSNESIGLKNINDRIILRYSDRYGISCEVKDGKTIFHVLLPIIKLDGESN